MSSCSTCGRNDLPVAGILGACGPCLRDQVKSALDRAERAHREVRRYWGLPENVPRTEEGIPCTVCANECLLAEGETGSCGLRFNREGVLCGVSDNAAKVSWYLDPLPTNCVADWVCAGGTGSGYPEFARCAGPEVGCRNLAVFFTACSYNCLFCQNWTYRRDTFGPRYRSREELVSAVEESTSCICYFGGDPSVQTPYALRTARDAIDRAGGRILRICWETNGSQSSSLMDEMAEISLSTGGCVKFDIKAWTDSLHRALAGVSNRRTLDNFSRVAAWIKERPDPPLLVASTLLVPGYIDADEIGGIASFIASADPDIPYSLLAFHPRFMMSDLTTTSSVQAQRCLAAARDAGLTRVKVGNVHLLRE